MLLVFKDMSREEMYRMVHEVYIEASYEIAKEKYPELEDLTEAIREEEAYFVEKFLGKFMSKDENTYYVWEEDGQWVSALRMTKTEEHFFMEALETAPDYRKKGFASMLIKAVIQELQASGNVRIRSVVRKTNQASLATHKKCGFVIDNTQEQERFYGMLF